MTWSPSPTDARSFGTATTAGRPKERARIAACEVFPPPLGHEGDDLVARDPNGVRRGQLVGDEDAGFPGKGRQPVDGPFPFSERPLQDRGDVVEVGRPKGEVLVGEVPEPRGQGVGDDLDRPLRVDLLEPDLLLDRSEEGRVPEEERVGLEDRGVFLPEARLDLARHLADLADRRFDGEPEPFELGRDLVDVEVPTGRRVGPPDADDGSAHGDAGRHRDSGEGEGPLHAPRL
jgi:hypothetical protein